MHFGILNRFATLSTREILTKSEVDAYAAVRQRLVTLLLLTRRVTSPPWRVTFYVMSRDLWRFCR